jgi:hypothetical protein
MLKKRNGIRKTIYKYSILNYSILVIILYMLNEKNIYQTILDVGSLSLIILDKSNIQRDY